MTRVPLVTAKRGLTIRQHAPANATLSVCVVILHQAPRDAEKTVCLTRESSIGPASRSQGGHVVEDRTGRTSRPVWVSAMKLRSLPCLGRCECVHGPVRSEHRAGRDRTTGTPREAKCPLHRRAGMGCHVRTLRGRGGRFGDTGARCEKSARRVLRGGEGPRGLAPRPPRAVARTAATRASGSAVSASRMRRTVGDGDRQLRQDQTPVNAPLPSVV